MAAVLALAIEVRRLVELVIARRLGGGRHAGVERRGAEDAGGDERAHQAFGENTHYKSFPGSAIPSLGEIGCFGEKTSRSEEHTSELQSLMRISYAVFCLKKKK